MKTTEENESVAMINGKKTYFSISEVCSQTDLEPHVLRYWETEFSQLRPKKNRAGNRAYREKDIEIIRYIKRLLYEEQFTIPGAKKKLTEARHFEGEQIKLEVLPVAKPTVDNGKLAEVKKELNDLLVLLST
jgi:DNA-binding transcriptional MerR regulator